MNRWPKATQKEQKKKQIHSIEKKLVDVETLLERLEEAVSEFQNTRDHLHRKAGYSPRVRWAKPQSRSHEDPSLN